MALFEIARNAFHHELLNSVLSLDAHGVASNAISIYTSTYSKVQHDF